uniref:Secreted protein n=1 Tax=Calcidiscus leptoporus TaxID=127549 RepID=A0A7S0IIA1_9EUKA
MHFSSLIASAMVLSIGQQMAEPCRNPPSQRKDRLLLVKADAPPLMLRKRRRRRWPCGCAVHCSLVGIGSPNQCVSLVCVSTARTPFYAAVNDEEPALSHCVVATLFVAPYGAWRFV